MMGEEEDILHFEATGRGVWGLQLYRTGRVLA